MLRWAEEARASQRDPDAGAGPPTPDVFLLLGEAGKQPCWTVARLLATIRSLPEGTTEIMCHPGHFDADLAHSRYTRQREVELAALTDLAVREAIHATGVELITYAALAGVDR